MRVLEVGFVGVRVPKVFAPQGLGYSFFGFRASLQGLHSLAEVPWGVFQDHPHAIPNIKQDLGTAL